MKIFKFSKNLTGGALMQVLISGALMNIALINVFAGIESGFSLTQRQLNRIEAIRIADTLMDELYLNFTDDPRLLPGSHIILYDRDGVEVISDEKYTAEWVITPDSPLPKMKKIDLEVRWQERGVPRKLSITSYRN